MAGKQRPDWYLEAWMGHFGLNQTELRERTGWSLRKASEICTGDQRFNRDSLNDAAAAMEIKPFELLMHPDEAHHIRRLRAAAEEEYRLRVAEEQRAFQGEAPPEARLKPPARRIN